ncbi:hypothetical protein ACFP3U_25295 [Kitasatospora misakiensis]|uniref:Uncharacterized protein n=1 Tax=Kitasatospora misakiensis TaxID=67330 RepID=A0ABW0X9A2_9ACTN
MRPSYDAEHPHSTTPIYDELYSEYRRLFRALPGDRSGEEDLKFAGFAVRDGFPGRAADHRSYPPQQQAFQTYGGQAIGIPQFMPNQPGGPDHTGPAEHPGHTGHLHHTGHTGHGANTGHTGHSTSPYATGFHAQTPPHASQPHGQTHHSQAHGQAQAQAQPHSQAQYGTGQGWVAAGYLGSVPHPMAAHVPAPAPVTVPVPASAPVMGTAYSHGPGGPGGTSGGRHRSLLSLPPGRSGEHH